MNIIFYISTFNKKKHRYYHIQILDLKIYLMMDHCFSIIIIIDEDTLQLPS